MNTECLVEIPADKLRDAIKVAFDYSRPQGLGFLHHREGGLSEADVDDIIEEAPSRIAASMDYVHGRSCKFTVFREGDRLFVRPSWYDHCDEQLQELLSEIGVKDGASLIAAAREAQRLENEKWDRENPR